MAYIPITFDRPRALLHELIPAPGEGLVLFVYGCLIGTGKTCRAVLLDEDSVQRLDLTWTAEMRVGVPPCQSPILVLPEGSGLHLQLDLSTTAFGTVWYDVVEVEYAIHRGWLVP